MEEMANNGGHPPCPGCFGPMAYLLEKQGSHIPQFFKFFQCSKCHFISVVNPILDYDKIYNEAYYQGRGADPLIDYAFELDYPEKTIRIFEWQGILDAVRHLYREELEGARWLDDGSGAGGLVRFLRDRGIEAYGFDQGEYVDRARARGIQHLTLSEMTGQRGSFNVVSLIEVLQHIPDPLSLLRTVRKLLCPGGLLFLTTGNVDPHCRVFASWEYVVPEVHVSYFSPTSLRQALDRAGLVASPLGKTPGVTNIIKYKILKNLGLKSVTPLFRILPWSVICLAADLRYQISAMPIAIRPRE